MPDRSEHYERARTYAEGDIAYGDAAATAQVSAMLAVVDELRALREAVGDFAKEIRSLGSPGHRDSPAAPGPPRHPTEG